MSRFSIRLAAPFGLLASFVVAGGASAAPIIFSASGANPAAIQGTVDAFRAALGDPNNGNAPGPLVMGRREINWDGGGQATTLSPTPFNGFENIRGALFTTPGTGFVQAPPSGLATTFANPTYANFQTFSAPRLFSAIGSNVNDTTFSIPGSGGTMPAFVSGFGAVFADVDVATSTSIQYFDLAGNSLGTFFAPAANNGLSFLGVFFNAGEQVGRVRVTSGNVAPGPNDNPPGTDVVMMDDFIYGEPQGAVPEPTGLALLGIGGAGLLLRRYLRVRGAPRGR